MDARPGSSLTLRILGGFELRAADGRDLTPPGKKLRALIASLSLPPGKAWSRERLAALLWGDREEEQARGSLRQALAELRRLVNEPAPLLADREIVSLDPAAFTVDAIEFDRLAKAAKLGEAAALYRGELLDGFGIHSGPFEDWLLVERTRLHDLAVDVLTRLTQAQAGDQAIETAQRLLHMDGTREETHRLLMRLHAAEGRRAQAIRQYHICRDNLHRELAAKPDAETEQLFRAIQDEKVPSAAIAHLAQLMPSGDRPSIAVLPFSNLSDEPEQEYFTDGITEDIITDLSKVSALNVLSRSTMFAFKGKAIDVGQIAQRLRVGYVVEGSVRKAGGRVRITAQLIDASKDNHVWGERYDRDLNDIFALQDEITRAIVAALKIRLLPAEKKAIASRSTRNPAAYQNYLQGRHHYLHFGVKNLEIAIRFGQRALEIDPQYARAWVLIAVCRSTLRIRGRSDDSGLAAAEKALSLDPTLAEAHSARGRILADLGRHEEAVAELEESVRLDPDSPEVRFDFGQTCFASGRYEAAIEHLERAAALSEESFDSLSYLAQVYQTLGREAEAIDAARRALAQIERRIALHPDDALSLSWGIGLFVQLGDKERAKEWISRVLIVEPDDAVVHFNLACSFAQMGEMDRALDLLESAAGKMPAVVVDWLRSDSDLAPLRGEPRYQALIARGEARLSAVPSDPGSQSS